jgi:hypothetical protein
LINNRQGGRRRGRGGQGGGRNLGGQPGNRQDNRQRGNAAQLLEKYKSMARDAQLAGDRVQTEYYLQFADHYFRVLSESRSRFEEQNPRRQRDDGDGDDEDGDEQYDDAEGSADESRDERPARSERHERNDRPERQERSERPDRSERQERADRPDRAAQRRPSRRAQAEDSSATAMNGGETIPFDVLPPAIGRDANGSASPAAEDAPKPRRRARAPRAAEGDEERAPAV